MEQVKQQPVLLLYSLKSNVKWSNGSLQLITIQKYVNYVAKVSVGYTGTSTLENIILVSLLKQ